MVKIRQDIEENEAAQLEGYPKDFPKNLTAKLNWFQDQKIGVIFHWGLYAQAGIVESWQLSKADDWARNPGWREDIETLQKDYWQLNESFNPVNFNPQEWAKACVQAGFKYMIFTTKHHDGFNMYDTQESDYKITGGNSLFKDNPQADVFKAVTTAFRDAGLAIGAYYSKADWHSQYYWQTPQLATRRTASYDPLEKPQLWQAFNGFVFRQLIEIVEQYGPIDILWLDAGWVNAPGLNEQLEMPRIVDRLRKTTPDLLVVDRTIGGTYENYVTPERKIPEVPPVKVWESNIPLANNWGYVPNDHYKDFSEILESVVKIVALGGNVILGVGPKPDGTLPKPALEIMQQLGQWLARFGEGIYQTRAFQIPQLDGWYFTQKADSIYAFTMAKEATLSLEKIGLSKMQTVEILSNSAQVNQLAATALSVKKNADEAFAVIKIKR